MWWHWGKENPEIIIMDRKSEFIFGVRNRTENLGVLQLFAVWY